MPLAENLPREGEVRHPGRFGPDRQDQSGTLGQTFSSFQQRLSGLFHVHQPPATEGRVEGGAGQGARRRRISGPEGQIGDPFPLRAFGRHGQHGRRDVEADDQPCRTDAVSCSNCRLTASGGHVQDAHSGPEVGEFQHPLAERRGEARFHGVVASPHLLDGQLGRGRDQGPVTVTSSRYRVPVQAVAGEKTMDSRSITALEPTSQVTWYQVSITCSWLEFARPQPSLSPGDQILGVDESKGVGRIAVQHDPGRHGVPEGVEGSAGFAERDGHPGEGAGSSIVDEGRHRQRAGTGVVLTGALRHVGGAIGVAGGLGGGYGIHLIGDPPFGSRVEGEAAAAAAR